jgi:hypothetical protein
MVIISPSVGALLPALNIDVFSILMYLLATHVYGQGEFRGRRRFGPRVLTSVLNAHTHCQHQHTKMQHQGGRILQ